jgi:hypothetical protein
MAKTAAPSLVRIKSYSKNSNLPFNLHRTVDWNVENVSASNLMEKQMLETML